MSKSGADFDELHFLAAQLDVEATSEGAGGHDADAVVAQNARRGVFLGDDFLHGVGIGFGAAGVVAIVMAIDDDLDRLSKALGELALKPFARLPVDGIDEEDAVRGDQEDAVVVVVMEVVDVSRDLLNRPAGGVLGRGRQSQSQE
jgi:hypothetical protein